MCQQFVGEFTVPKLLFFLFGRPKWSEFMETWWYLPFSPLDQNDMLKYFPWFVMIETHRFFIWNPHCFGLYWPITWRSAPRSRRGSEACQQKGRRTYIFFKTWYSGSNGLWGQLILLLCSIFLGFPWEKFLAGRIASASHRPSPWRRNPRSFMR